MEEKPFPAQTPLWYSSFLYPVVASSAQDQQRMNDMKCSFSLPAHGHSEREHVLSQMEITAS